MQLCEAWKYVQRLNQVCGTRIRWSMALRYILRQSILFCWVAWCNMMCKVWTDDAGGCDDHPYETRPRVLSTLREGSIPFWHWLHLRNLLVEHYTGGFHTHNILYDFYSRVLSTLLEGSIPFWHWLHLRNLKVICLLVEHCTGGFHTHKILYDFYPRVLSTLLEGSIPFWHWLHLRNLKVITHICLLVKHF